MCLANIEVHLWLGRLLSQLDILLVFLELYRLKRLANSSNRSRTDHKRSDDAFLRYASGLIVTVC